MARSELADRHAFSYPPYSRLLRLTLRDENVTLLRRGALALSDALREKFGRRVAGPVAPPIDKIRGQYIVCVMIKIENGRSMARARELLREAIAAFRADAEYKTITLSIDVDAQ